MCNDSISSPNIFWLGAHFLSQDVLGSHESLAQKKIHFLELKLPFPSCKLVAANLSLSKRFACIAASGSVNRHERQRGAGKERQSGGGERGHEMSG